MRGLASLFSFFLTFLFLNIQTTLHPTTTKHTPHPSTLRLEPTSIIDVNASSHHHDRDPPIPIHRSFPDPPKLPFPFGHTLLWINGRFVPGKVNDDVSVFERARGVRFAVRSDKKVTENTPRHLFLGTDGQMVVSTACSDTNANGAYNQLNWKDNGAAENYANSGSHEAFRECQRNTSLLFYVRI